MSDEPEGVDVDRPLDDEEIARIVHVVDFTYNETLGEETLPWPAIKESQTEAVRGCRTRLAMNLTLTPAQIHGQWRQAKLDQGWKKGPKKDSEKKTHPMLVEWGDLTNSQRRKSVMFEAIVKALVCDVS